MLVKEMRKEFVAKILRKYGFVPKHSTLKDISWKKNIMYPNATWKQFLLNTFTVFYLTDELPEEGIFIKELNFQLGGTVTYDVRNKETVNINYSSNDMNQIFRRKEDD